MSSPHRTFSYGERIIAQMLAEWAPVFAAKLGVDLEQCGYSPRIVDAAINLGQDDLIEIHLDRHEGPPQSPREAKYHDISDMMFSLSLAPRGSIPPFGGFSDDDEAEMMAHFWRRAVNKDNLAQFELCYTPENSKPLRWWAGLAEITQAFEWTDETSFCNAFAITSPNRNLDYNACRL